MGEIKLSNTTRRQQISSVLLTMTIDNVRVDSVIMSVTVRSTTMSTITRDFLQDHADVVLFSRNTREKVETTQLRHHSPIELNWNKKISLGAMTPSKRPRRARSVEVVLTIRFFITPAQPRFFTLDFASDFSGLPALR